jgi:hypothetical protein
VIMFVALNIFLSSRRKVYYNFSLKQIEEELYILERKRKTKIERDKKYEIQA